jgi:hypothetical protein
LIAIAVADIDGGRAADRRRFAQTPARALASGVFPDGMAHIAIRAESASIHRLSVNAAWAEGAALLTLRLDEAP